MERLKPVGSTLIFINISNVIQKKMCVSEPVKTIMEENVTMFIEQYQEK